MITTSLESSAWFRSILLSSGSDSDSWEHAARPDFSLGVLCSVPLVEDAPRSGPRPTEILFYATHALRHNRRTTPATPPPSSPTRDEEDSASEWRFCAVYLSSDLLHAQSAVIPHLSPSSHDSGVFLAPHFPQQEVVHEPPVKRMRVATVTLDEAVERRKSIGKAKSRTNQPIDPGPQDTERRSFSGQTLPPQTRPLSRSPSVSSIRPASVRGMVAEGSKRSALSNVQIHSGCHRAADKWDPVCAGLEQKNKDMLSRLVIAGMRLYGFSQPKSQRRSCANSPHPDSPMLQDSSDAERHEAFKLLYHQVYRSTCFVLRAHVATTPLQNFTDVLRETVDQFLSIYTTDPLDCRLPPWTDDGLTPGGRVAFKTVDKKTTELKT